MANTIITIGRQFGSGGREIGKRLAERLDIPLYDYTLLRMTAKEMGVDLEKVEEVDESLVGSHKKKTIIGSKDYMLFMSGKDYEEPLSDKVYEKQAVIMKKLAESGSCIFVGRCADYVLKDEPKCISTFVCANDEERTRRIMELYDLSEKKAWNKIVEVDNTRKEHYEKHTGREWGSLGTHQVVFNSSVMGLDGVVDALEGIYKKWEEK